eukprot:TRINITY_DN3643_c0_g1_i1.p1 TRINITY_DN3643_c0_g1~~TRINITY_DN3643_c0_g1_i1.p1  ORF type:complete len:188 (+),score=70.26 TRINITY_DN3643_c0_g1_i1:55-618(+)
MVCPCDCEITQWKDPKKSGIVFGSGILLYLVLMWVEFCPIRLAIFAVQVGIVVCFGLSFTQHRIQPKNVEALTETVQETLRKATEAAEPFIVEGLMQVNKIATMTDRVRAAKCLVLTFVLGYVFSIISLTTILLLGWIVAFAWPKVYEKNQKQIDDAASKANAAFAEHVKKVPKLAEALGYNQKKSE